MLKLLLLLASPAWAIVPTTITATDTVKIGQQVTGNLLELAKEIKRTSLIDGGEINQHVKVSSSVQLSADGITFSDGTKQTTAATDATGQTETWLFDSSQTLTAVNAATFTLTAGESYRLHLNLIKNTAGHLRLRFNGDDGNNYKWATNGHIPGTGTVDDSATGTAQIYLYAGGGHSIGNTEYLNGSVDMHYQYDDNTIVFTYGQTQDSSGSADYINNAHGKYDGASNVTSVALVVSAGTFTGRMVLFKATH